MIGACEFADVPFVLDWVEFSFAEVDVFFLFALTRVVFWVLVLGVNSVRFFAAAEDDFELREVDEVLLFASLFVEARVELDVDFDFFFTRTVLFQKVALIFITPLKNKGKN